MTFLGQRILGTIVLKNELTEEYIVSILQPRSFVLHFYEKECHEMFKPLKILKT